MFTGIIETLGTVKNIVKEQENVVTIGTGGNISKIFKVSGQKANDFISYQDIEGIVNAMDSFELEERIEKFNLKPNRADVIVLAGKIYLFAMKSAKSTNMLVPKMGLADGLINELALRHV